VDEKNGGSFSLRPSAPFCVEREYLDDSAILQTRFITDRGVVKLTDFFVIARKSNARFYDFTTLHATRRLVRLVELSLLKNAVPARSVMRIGGSYSSSGVHAATGR
jgi:hypothetical protein